MSRTANLRRRVWQKTGGLCWICGGPVLLDPERLLKTQDRMSLDHVVAKADGGKYTYSNLMPAHHECNKNRGRNAPNNAVDLQEK